MTTPTNPPPQPEPVKEQELKPCPFCKDTGYDLVGIKSHLTKGECEAFEAIEVFTSLFDSLSKRTPPVQDEQRNGDWIDKFGSCKVCGGEVPHGHTDNCDVYKLERETQNLKERVRKLVEAAQWAVRGMEGLAKKEADREKCEVHLCRYTFLVNLQNVLRSINLDGEKGGEG